MRGKIFINYRREATAETAGRLYDRMAQAFGHENLFVDFVGADLKARLNNQLPMCQAFLTVIGPSWLDAKDEAGQRRIHGPNDFVVAEIVAALAHNIPVIPVLVDGAHMPLMSELPDPWSRSRAANPLRFADFILTGMPQPWSNEHARRSIKNLSDRPGGEPLSRCGASGHADSNWREYLHVHSTYRAGRC